MLISSIHMRPIDESDLIEQFRGIVSKGESPGGYKMKNRRGVVSGAALLCVTVQAHAQTATPVQATPASVLVVSKPAEVVSGSSLPSNSEVWLSFDQELNSKKAKQGDKFNLTVARDVMLGNYIVIPRGTPAHGQISYRTGKGAFGKSGKMEFDLIDVTLPARVIPVAGHYRVEGQGNTGATVGALVAVGVFSAFVKGHSATVAQGSEWKASTKEPLVVAFSDAAQLGLANASAAAPVTKVETPPVGSKPATVVKTN